jgi:hypothetical protein
MKIDEAFSFKYKKLDMRESRKSNPSQHDSNSNPFNHQTTQKPPTFQNQRDAFPPPSPFIFTFVHSTQFFAPHLRLAK